MKRGLLSPALIRESHDCAIALRTRLRCASFLTNLLQPARDTRVLAAKDAAKPCEESMHGRKRAPLFSKCMVKHGKEFYTA